MSKNAYRHSILMHIVFRSIGLAANTVWAILAIIPHKLANRTRVALIHDDHILLIQNITDFRDWTLPGGGYHANESAKQCALRETSEELGIRASEDQLIPMGQFSSIQRGMQCNYDTFIVNLTENPSLKISWEIAHAKWVPLSQLPTNISDFIPKMLEQRRDS